MSVLEVRNLNVQYHTEQGVCQAVCGVSFSVEKGEIAGIVGESGSGKSTAMRAVMGLLKSNARVTADEIRVSGESPRPGRNIAMIFQDSLSCLNPSVRIGRQIAETVRVREGCTWREAKKRALELLDLVGIRQPRIRMRQYPFELSGGMRQRVVIAIALACRPDLIIADEPTTALDAAVQAQILLLLRRIVRETGTSLLLVSHDLGVIASMCSSVYVMHSGEIVESGCAEDIFYAPREDYTRELLESAAGRTKDMRRSLSEGRPRADREEILLSLEHVTRQYDSHEGVRDISLTLEEGKTYALVGESGSGKTTLARILSGILKPDSGSVLYSGREAEGSACTGKIQMVFQDPAASLNPCLTAGQTLEEALRAADRSGVEQETTRKMSAREKKQIRRDRAAAMLEQVGLSAEDMGKYPGSFSGGQRQRIAIARALITGPELLICDEALSSLDAMTGSRILELLLRFQRERGISILFISHDLHMVRRVSSRVGVLYGGRLVESGRTKEVCSDPWHPYTRQLLDAVPEADPVRARKIRTSYVQEQDRGEKKDGCGCPFAGRCGYAMDCCFEETPGNYIFGSRMVSCFLYSQEHSGRRGEGYTMTSQI